jgi:hypothetical protein
MDQHKTPPRELYQPASVAKAIAVIDGFVRKGAPRPATA